MFEWPTATPVDLETYPRRKLYEHFLTFEIPVTTRTVQIDVTELVRFTKSARRRFSLTLGFVLTRANNHVPELRHRIQDDVLVAFDKVIPSFTILSPEKLLYFAKGVYTDDFEADYEENRIILENAANGLDPNVGVPNQGQIFITNNPWNSFTAIQAPYTRRFASAPVYCIGKLYEEHGRTKAGLGIQNHHGLTDGYHIGHFLDILQKHLDEPERLTRPFTSTFR